MGLYRVKKKKKPYFGCFGSFSARPVTREIEISFFCSSSHVFFEDRVCAWVDWESCSLLVLLSGCFFVLFRDLCRCEPKTADVHRSWSVADSPSPSTATIAHFEVYRIPYSPKGSRG